jgi:adenine-specific DNA-methyltransferase
MDKARDSGGMAPDRDRPVNSSPVARVSADVLAERVEELKRIFPEAETEGKVDFEKLKATLGEFTDERAERYSFTWAGKRDCIRMLQTPSRATLIPCPEESIAWDTTNNVFIEGENLEVLKLLYKAYYGRVKMICIDPPYNTGKDFIYPDNYADPLDTYLRLTGQKDSEGNILTSNPETSGRYHSAWLSMMYPRLFVARQLLKEDGVIFISIDDNEVYNLRMMMNEIFGEENFVTQITWKNVYGGGAKSKHVVPQHEYVLLFARNKDVLGEIELPPDPAARKRYTERDQRFDLRGPFFTQPLATTSMDTRPNLRFPIHWQGHEILPDKQWQWSKERVEQALANDELVVRREGDKWSVRYKQYLRDEQGQERHAKLYSILTGPWSQDGTLELVDIFGNGKVFPFPKPSKLIKQLLGCVWRDREAVVLDFFAGSCPTAQALLCANREYGGSQRFIMVQLPEPTVGTDFSTIADIGKERIRRVIAKMKKEDAGKLLTGREGKEDLGFKVFKLAESNYASWRGVAEPKPAGYVEQMKAFADTLVSGWKPDNVIYEVALKEAGYGLSCRIEELSPPRHQDTKKSEKGQKKTTATDDGHGPRIFRVTDPDKEQFFFICLDDKIRLADLRPLNLTREVLFVCRDKALDDEAAANLALQCRLKTI